MLTNNATPVVTRVEETFVVVTMNVKPVVRKDKIGDTEYLVAPATILLEGVHNGNHGPLYYPYDEVSQTPAAWNHKPVVVHHPNEGQETACTPEFLTSNGVGLLLNTKVSGRKLRTEAWFEVNALSRVDKRVEAAVLRQHVMEVSTGMYMNVEWTEGDWNGEHYVGIARNYKPDHLAILPDQIGACSIADGAGLMQMNAEQRKTALPKSWTDDFFPFMRAVGINVDSLIMNELSFNDVRDQLRALLKNAWVVEVYKDHFVYELEGGRLFDQKYEVKNEVASLVGAAEEVVRVVQYKSKAGVIIGNAVKELTNMTKKEAIDALVANGQCKETDRLELEKMPEVTLSSLADASNKAKEKLAAAEANTATRVSEAVANAVKQGTAGIMPPTTTTVTNNASVRTTEEHLASLPPEVARQVRHGLATYNAQHAAAVAKLAANPKCKFTAEQLKAKDLDELNVLVDLAEAPVTATTNRTPLENFVGQGDPVGTANAAAGVEPLLVPVYNFEETKPAVK